MGLLLSPGSQHGRRDMGHIYYALSGEGRGHATRARTVIEALRREHRLTVYAYHHAREVLGPIYRSTDVTVRSIPGLRFRYGSSGRLDYLRTAASALPFLFRLGHFVDRVRRDMDADAPSMAITDFEPIVPRAAQAAGVPFISLDHQHFLTAYDLSSLPFKLRAYADFLSLPVHAFYRGQIRTIVSSFYSPPLKRAQSHVSRVGVLLRPEVLTATPTTGDHLVAYLRRHAPDNVLRALAEAGPEVRVYGLGHRERVGKLVFREVDLFRVVDDLASARALVSTAGNQVVGEALSLHKPVLAMPEHGNFEQEINAHFLAQSGTGRSLHPARLDADAVRAFIGQSDSLRASIDARSVCGNSSVMALIDHHLRQIELGAPTEMRPRRGPSSQGPRVVDAEGAVRP